MGPSFDLWCLGIRNSDGSFRLVGVGNLLLWATFSSRNRFLLGENLLKVQVGNVAIHSDFFDVDSTLIRRRGGRILYWIIRRIEVGRR